MKPSPALSIAVSVLLTLIWGTTWAAVSVGLQGIPPLTGVALRFGIAAAVLVGIGLARKVPFGRGRHERGVWLSNGVLSFCISYGVVYWAQQWVPSGLAAVLWATFPLFLALMAHFTLDGERLRPATGAGIVLGFAGVACIFSEDLTLLGGERVALASAVFLLSPLAAAVSNIVIKKWAGDIHPVSLAGVPMGMAAAFMGSGALIFERNQPVVFNASAVAALLYLAVCGSAVTFGLYYWLLQHYTATRLSLIAYGVPVVAVLVGTLVLKEPITPRILAGGAMVVLGVALAIGVSGRDTPAGRRATVELAAESERPATP